MKQSYDILIEKLKKYKNKYFLIKSLKGFIIFTAIALTTGIIISMLLYYVFLSSQSKTVLFILIISLLSLAFIDLVLLPLSKIWAVKVSKQTKNITKNISEQDKSLAENINTILDLREKYGDNKLALAAIEQKVEKLKLINFSELLSWKTAVGYFKYLAVVLVISGYFLIFHGKEIYIGAQNFIFFDRESKIRQPFEFVLENKKLEAKQGEDFTIKLKIKGKYLPQEVFIVYDGNKYLMAGSPQNATYTYRLKNVNKNLSFYFQAERYRSKTYKLEVKPAPVLKNFSIEVTPPSYTGLSKTEYKNITDIKVAEGSRLLIKLHTKHIDSLVANAGNKLIKLGKNGKNKFYTEISALNNMVISLSTTDSNKILKLKIKVIKDAYPSIEVRQIQDSLKLSLYYFVGSISDDYGFKSLKFCYYCNDTLKQVNIKINPGQSTEQFYFYFDFDSLKTKASSIEYYFEVRDNDFINGYKATKSSTFYYKVPNAKSIMEELDSNSTYIQNNYEKSTQLINDIRQQIEDIQKQLLNEQLSDWERKSLLDELKNKQEQLQQYMQKMNKDLMKKNAMLNTYTKDKELVKKQMQIQKMLEQLLNEEMKKLMDEINKLMKEQNQNNLSKKLKNLDYNYKNLEQELDRTLELLKREEIKQKVEEQAETLKKMSQEQKELSEETKHGKKSKEELLDKQTELKFNSQFLQQNYKSTIEKNKQLERPFSLPNLDSLFNQLNNSMREAEDQLSKGNKRKAAKAQQKAAETMQKISEQMQNSLQSSSMTMNGEDLNSIKKMVSDLIYFSFSWEALYNQIQNAYVNSKIYSDAELKAKNLSEEFDIIRDSIWSLAKRNPQINKPVITDLRKIIKNNKEILNLLENRNKNKVLQKNREIIADINDLALLLSEIAKQMEEMMKNASASGKGDKKSNMQKMGQMQDIQQSLEEQLKQMLEQIKKGDKATSEQLAKALAEQQLLEQMLEEFMQNETLSPEIRKKLNEIKKLNDQTQKDLIYKNVSPETLIRQQQIKVKLLETENALKKQGKENKREAQTGENIFNRNPEKILDEYLKKTENIELIKNQNIKLNNFYKNYFSKYLNFIR